jgi:hypothetical protein
MGGKGALKAIRAVEEWDHLFFAAFLAALFFGMDHRWTHSGTFAPGNDPDKDKKGTGSWPEGT